MMMGVSGVRAVFGEQVTPCTAMAMVEFFIIAFTILASTGMAKGMSPFVFVVYTNALGSILLLPFSFLHHRDKSSDGPSILSLDFFIRVFFLGLVGIAIAQNLGFLGLYYSSPIVACGMANIIPALSFILGFILRTTNIDWKSSGSQARIIGSLISISGAVLLTLYRGPTIKGHSSPSLFLQQASPPRLLVFLSTHQNWIRGCIFYAAASVALSVWNVIQDGTVKHYPQVRKIMSFYSLFGTIQTAVFALFVERDPSAWKLELNFELYLIILTAIFSSLIRSSIQIWCMRSKGPYFVPTFKPLGIPIASSFGCLLFADTFHYGSMISAVICGVGYYTVMWGQMKEDEMKNEKSKQSISEEKVPLLHDPESQV